MHDDLPDGWDPAPGPGTPAAGGGRTRGEDREGLLARTLVGLSDTLGDEGEPGRAVRGLAGRCVRLAGVAAAAVLLADEEGGLRVVSASCPPARLLAAQGPGPASWRAGEVVTAEDPRAEVGDGFVRRAAGAGYRGVAGVPLRHGDEVVGALVVFRVGAGPLPAEAAGVLGALAEAAAIGVLQRRARRRQERLAEQLQTALDSRVPVEQAKGLLAERFQVSVEEAFALLRAYARAHRLSVTTLASAVLLGTATVPGP